MAWDDKAYQEHLMNGGAPLKGAAQSGSSIVITQEGNGPGAKTPDIPNNSGGAVSSISMSSKNTKNGGTSKGGNISPVPTTSKVASEAKTTSGAKTTSNSAAYGIINEMKNSSLGWHTATPEQRQALNQKNKQLADSLSAYGIDVTYNPQSGTYTYADGTNLYDTQYVTGMSEYPKYTPQDELIKQTYETALMNQIAANEEAIAMQKAIMQQNLKQAQADLEVQRRQSATDTAMTLENEKLRQELRGSKGGIGERIFGTYESAGSQRLLEINLEEQRLKADTAAQIAQLEAEGKFAEAQLVSQFAIEKMNALASEAERVYNAEVAAANYNTNQYWKEKSFENDKKLLLDDEGVGQGSIPPAGEVGTNNYMKFDEEGNIYIEDLGVQQAFNTLLLGIANGDKGMEKRALDEIKNVYGINITYDNVEGSYIVDDSIKLENVRFKFKQTVEPSEAESVISNNDYFNNVSQYGTVITDANGFAVTTIGLNEEYLKNGINGKMVIAIDNGDGTFNYIATSPVEQSDKQVQNGTFRPITDEVVSAVLRGDYGNGQERIDRLTAAGYDYDEVQRLVNKKAGGVPPGGYPGGNDGLLTRDEFMSNRRLSNKYESYEDYFGEATSHLSEEEMIRLARQYGIEV